MAIYEETGVLGQQGLFVHCRALARGGGNSSSHAKERASIYELVSCTSFAGNDNLALRNPIDIYLA